MKLGPRSAKLTTQLIWNILQCESTSIVMFREVLRSAVDTSSRQTECVPPAVCRLLLVIACHLPQHSGDQSLDSPIRTAVCNMEILLLNKPGTVSANNNYLWTYTLYLCYWAERIRSVTNSCYKLFLINSDINKTSTRQKHFCMNEN